jgi:pimeloyl-ACP methyl ester carboxylesterase
MLRFARAFLEDAHRTVLVDLRGHGRSTGEYVAYGALESKDLSDLLDELARRDLLEEPVGVFGVSYGAAVAIQLAGRDPRILAVVAVAPFTSLQDVVPRYVRLFLPGWGWFASAAAIRDAVVGAGLRGGFDPDRASPLAAIRIAGARTLLIHGEDDFLIDRSHSERLHAARPDRSDLLLVPGVGHNGVFHDPERRVSGAAREWFDRWLVRERTRGSIGRR